jgi:anti-sigma B factor antagonist
VNLLARVAEERGDDVSVAAIEGEIDASNAGEVGARLRALLTNRSTLLVVDLSATAYLDSAGINLLFELSAELEHRQQQLRLVVAPASPIARVVAISGLDVAIPTHPTRAAALADDA